MTRPDQRAERSRPPAAGLVLMLLTVLWSGGLAAGFGYAAASDQPTGAARLGYLAAAAFLGLLAMRTLWELLRRLR